MSCRRVSRSSAGHERPCIFLWETTRDTRSDLCYVADGTGTSLVRLPLMMALLRTWRIVSQTILKAVPFDR